MRIPFKVSTTTSNFMIGVTAAASAGIYLSRGYIQPPLVMPVMLGVLAGFRCWAHAGLRGLAAAAAPALCGGCRRARRRDGRQRPARRFLMRDERLEQLVGTLLRIGVVLAAAIVLAGGAWYLAVSAQAPVAYRQFQPSVRNLRALGELPPAEALILAGLLVLIATPVARVILALVAFALERDITYVICTLIVLVILLYSIGTAWM